MKNLAEEYVARGGPGFGVERSVSFMRGLGLVI